jgi:hypothetical protein
MKCFFLKIVFYLYVYDNFVFVDLNFDNCKRDCKRALPDF